MSVNASGYRIRCMRFAELFSYFLMIGTEDEEKQKLLMSVVYECP